MAKKHKESIANSSEDYIDKPAIYEQDEMQSVPRVGMIVKTKKKKSLSIAYSDEEEKINYYKKYAVDMGFRTIQSLISKALHSYTNRNKNPYDKHT